MKLTVFGEILWDVFDQGKKIGGAPETKQFLEGLGFTVGEMVRVLSVMGGNLIVQVKESRVAINEELARKIMI